MVHYIALIHKQDDSDYGVSFPDFPGCVSAGVTLEEARRMGAEALAFHIEGLVEDGEPVPEPSTLDAVMWDSDNREGVAILVPAPLKSKTVRVNVTLPEDALRAIDAYAERHGYTRSGFLVSAAKQMMEPVSDKESAAIAAK
jgi:predicted RNase H-like HicB family nuclease